MKSRKIINCLDCNMQKEHFGYQRCSACLRKYKRKTKPEFYLNTCYSEVSRRCKTFDKIRPNYYGKNKCSKQEFINKFAKDLSFLSLYENWQNNNYERKHAPSIDRIDNLKDYTLDNIRFISQSFNSKKDCSNHIIINNIFFYSQADAAKYMNISPASLCKKLKNNDKINYKNYVISRIKYV